jgi:hypothetical protein
MLGLGRFYCTTPLVFTASYYWVFLSCPWFF